MIDTDSAAEVLMAAGLPSRPPHVLVTRWLALLADEDHLYLDVAFESGAGVPGTRYVFVAVTEAAVCYLHAEHDDDVWDQPRVSFNRKSESMTPRTLVAWRRPLTLVTEVGMGGDTWHWVDIASTGDPPVYALKFGQDAIEIPLRSPRRSRRAPDPAPVIALLTAAWRSASARR
ncbi:hypothetical protein [Tessaracoccus sp. O5.2]|uniref:hypothetical protein n=1 Tax=Tessaracoccus sp. O5.2 TaxID=3157622 RepID=UPI0036D7A091